MNDHAKTKQQLIDELQQLRQQVAELKAEEHQEAVLRSDARVQAAASADVQDSLRLKCEALFAQAIRSAQANIFCLDMGTGEFIASAATKALHRIPADAFINQEAVIATIHPEDRPRVEKAWEGCIERGDCCLTEYRVVQPDGNVRWIASQAQVFPGPHGPKFLGMCRDITERKQAEEQLRMSENRHRLLFDAMAEGFVLAEAIVDEHRLPVDFRVLEANPAAAELTGISIQAAIGKTARELIPGIGKEWIKTLGETALSGEATTFERYARSLNKWFHVLAYGLERDTFACFFVDITERKQIEDALRSTRDTLQTVLDTAPAGILVADQDGKFTLANAVALEIFGGSPTGNVYGPLGSYEVFHSDGSPVVPAELPLPRALYQGEITRQAELLIRRKDGSEVVVLAAATPLHDSEGRIRGAIAVLQDITERKHAEEALRQSEERLFFVVENSEDTIFIQDKDLRYLWVSKPTWPFTMNEILGKTDFDFEGPQEQFQRMVKIKRTVLHENSPVTTELSLSLKGRPRFFGVTYKPWCDAAGHVIGLAGYARDITVRKQADAALRQSEERLSGLRQLPIWAAGSSILRTITFRGPMRCTASSVCSRRSLERRMRHFSKQCTRTIARQSMKHTPTRSGMAVTAMRSSTGWCARKAVRYALFTKNASTYGMNPAALSAPSVWCTTSPNASRRRRRSG
ncbi:MAG TPA: PAS domain S-box protein, partial [Thermodesulfobacteriota bacterium]|nr:PAS domain S-box protein [Thermodesulfobacteriota bacterium]